MTTYVTIEEFIDMIMDETLPFIIHYGDGTNEEFYITQFEDGFKYTRVGVTDEYGEYQPDCNWGYMARKPIKKIVIPECWMTNFGVLPTHRGGKYFIIDEGIWEDEPQYVDSSGTEYYTRLWGDA